MEELFLKLVNMSITASYLVLAVLVLRVILKNAPKSIRVILWGLVGLRLAMPFSFESILSLIPSAEPLPEEFLYAATPQVHTGIASLNSAINPVIAESLTPIEPTSANPTQIWSFIFSRLWLIGVLLMAVYALVSFLMVRRKVAASIPVGRNIRLCDHIDTPFILGIIRPRIYLPSSLDQQTADHVLAHEDAHLKRHDHWWKPLGFLLLSIYWFNPVMWLAYILLCRDIELACDEKVVKELSTEEKKSYSTALLSCSVPRKMIAACPLAFGEVGVKGRIKSVLNYKKPAFWVIVVAIIACIAVAVCFLTDPETDASEEWADECRAVLERIQCMDAYAFHVDREFEGEPALNDTSSSQYLKYDSYRLRLCHIPADNTSDAYLDLDGDYYEGYRNGGDYVWQQTDALEEDIFAPWLCSFQWDDQKVDAIARQEKHDGYYIRLKVFESHTDGHESYDSYHVDFYFDPDGSFQYAVQSIVSEMEFMGETVSLTTTATMRPIGASDENILEMIAEYAQTVERDFDISLGFASLSDRLSVGTYVPVECIYMNPLSSYSAFQLSEEYVYMVTEEGFYTDSFAFICNTNVDTVDWGWKTMAEAAEDLAFYIQWQESDWSLGAGPKLDENTLYQRLDGGNHLLLSGDELYMIHGGPNQHEMELVWGIYRLEPSKTIHSSINGTMEMEITESSFYENAVVISATVTYPDDISTMDGLNSLRPYEVLLYFDSGGTPIDAYSLSSYFDTVGSQTADYRFVFDLSESGLTGTQFLVTIGDFRYSHGGENATEDSFSIPWSVPALGEARTFAPPGNSENLNVSLSDIYIEVNVNGSVYTTPEEVYAALKFLDAEGNEIPAPDVSGSSSGGDHIKLVMCPQNPWNAENVETVMLGDTVLYEIVVCQ